MFILTGFEDAHAQSSKLSISANVSVDGLLNIGSLQVTEVTVVDQIDSEPDITIDGKKLRMALATDGKWYGYFASKEHITYADSKVLSEGVGLDYGSFCSADTTIFGTSFLESDGIAIPRTGITDTTNGNSVFQKCSGGTGIINEEYGSINNDVNSKIIINNIDGTGIQEIFGSEFTYDGIICGTSTSAFSPPMKIDKCK